MTARTKRLARRGHPRRNGNMSPEELFREQMKQQAIARHMARVAGSESYDFEGFIEPSGTRFRNGVPVRSHAEARAYARGQIAQAMMHKPGVTGGEYRITHVVPRREPRLIEHVIVNGKNVTSVILNGQRVLGDDVVVPSRFDAAGAHGGASAPRTNPGHRGHRGRRAVRHNPRAPREIKHPFVVLVRRFDPTGEELARWEPLALDADGRPEFFLEAKAKAAALNPPRDADLHVGDLIAAVPVEFVTDIDNQAHRLFVVTPDDIKAAPKVPKELGEKVAWTAAWGQDASEMLRSASSVDRRRIVMAGCDCAETMLHIVPASEDRPREAVEAARSWCHGVATRDSLHLDKQTEADQQAAAADAAFRLGQYAIRDVANAAWAAAHSRSVGAPADGPAHFIAHAAHDYSGVAHETTMRALAPLVERWIPLPVILLSDLGYPDAIPFNLDGVQSAQEPRSNPRRRSGRAVRGRR